MQIVAGSDPVTAFVAAMPRVWWSSRRRKVVTRLDAIDVDLVHHPNRATISFTKWKRRWRRSGAMDKP